MKSPYTVHGRPPLGPAGDITVDGNKTKRLTGSLIVTTAPSAGGLLVFGTREALVHYDEGRVKGSYKLVNLVGCARVS